MSNLEAVLLAGNANLAAMKFKAQRQDDRFHSTISLVVDGCETTLLRSLEGGLDNPWPPSPPLQECLIQKVADQDVILATGMAGKTHWSVSVEVAKSGVGFTWDVACRTGHQDFALGSAYLFTEGMKTSIFDESQIEIESGSRLLTLQPLSTGGSRASLRCDDDSTVTIQPTEPYPALPGTFRWKYELILRDPQT